MGNIARCVAATLLVLTSSEAGLAAQPVLDGPAVVAGPTLDLRVPSPGYSMEAMRYVERRVSGDDTVKVPEPPPGEARDHGVTIVLRLRGVVVGRGQSFESPSNLRVAADEAVSAMRAKMPPARDALQEQALAADLARVQISLELAGPLVPAQAATFAEADSTLSPGLDGVALRLDKTLVATSPATMLERNQTPGPALAAAVSLVTGDATAAIPGTLKGELGTLLRERSMVAYRFRVVHVAHTNPGEPATFLVRGVRPVPATQLTQAELHRWGDGVASHIISRWRTDGTIDGRLLGVIWPMQGRADPDDASPPERALAALALAAHAQVAPPQPAAESRRVAAEILRSLADRERAEGGQTPLSPSAAALALEAIRLLAGDAGDPATPEVLEHISPFVTAVERGYAEPQGWSRSTPATARGTITLGLAAASDLLVRRDPDVSERLGRLARQALASVYTDTPQGSLVTHMPWLLRAETLLAGTAATIPAGTAMREVRDQVNQHMLTPSDVADESDLAGGVIFTQGRASLPTWYGARPLAASAQMLGDQRLTPRAEHMKELSSLLAGLRFLRQLTLDDANLWGVTSPEEAQWGVRAAAWDQRLPIDASSLTLLAVSESIASIERLAASHVPTE